MRFIPYKSKLVCRLTDHQKQQRLGYLLNMPSNPWRLLNYLKKRIVYDEKLFVLECPPNRQNVRYWGKDASSERYYRMDKNKNKTMVITAVSYFTKSDLY